MKSKNPIVANAVAANQRGANAIQMSRGLSMFINNHGTMWDALTSGKTKKAEEAYARWRKAIESMGAKVASDYAQESRVFADLLARLKNMGAISLVEWRESPLRMETKEARGRWDGGVKQSVKDYEMAWRENQSKRRTPTHKTTIDDDYLE